MDINWRRVTLLPRKRQPIHMHVSLLVSLINSYLAFSPFFFFIFPFHTFHLSQEPIKFDGLLLVFIVLLCKG